MWALLLNCVEINSLKPEFLLAEPNFPYIILSHLLLSLEMTRRLCRRVISEALPAIFPYTNSYIKPVEHSNIPLVNPLLKSVSCVLPPIGTGINEKSPYVIIFFLPCRIRTCLVALKWQVPICPLEHGP